ncbi:hypothetical protein [Escherichia coli]|uniref:hypothetical protein n=1 Tax=Escherichia coli TaxID=562 RepID=UPI00191B2468|nr:hypothetical protein [Escherichia coli]CAD5739920.1 Uncharacterised protein [Escherichia coli]
MSKTKISVAVGMILSLATLSTYAAQTKTYANTSVTGSVTIAADCTLTAALQHKDVTLTDHNLYKPGHIFDVLTVTPTCDSKVWVQGKDRDSQGFALAKDSENNEIPLALFTNSPGFGTWNSSEQLITSKDIVKANSQAKLDIGFGYGLPPLANVLGKKYSYTLNIGYWAD